MKLILTQFIPVAIFFASMCLPLSIALYTRHQRKTRRNPLTSQMLRAPGESISQRIEALNDDVDLYLAFSLFSPLLVYSIYLSTLHYAHDRTSPLIFVVMGVGFLSYFSVRLNKATKLRHNEYLGLDCERAVGQELNQLMLQGCRVFHDFQADNFNIDHVVIGGNGVFAIETKGRAKPNRGMGGEDAKVIYDGLTLQFPTWREKEPLEQAKRQAEWLSKWLSKAVGEQVTVIPVLALPGWFVDRRKPGFPIFNGKNPQFMTKLNTESNLSAVLIQRIAHQIEQRCRDVAPLAYKR